MTVQKPVWCACFPEAREFDVLHTDELCIWFRKVIMCGQYDYNVHFSIF